jgi:hypothetical protein
MNVNTAKVELIDWIVKINDLSLINKILNLKKELSVTGYKGSTNYGSGKHLIDYVSDDFNEPLDVFKEYTK